MEADHQAQMAASQQDSSPPHVRSERAEPPTKEEILAIAHTALASLQETLQNRFGTQDVDEDTKTAVAKSLHQTCDVYLANLNLTELPVELTDVLRQGVTRITFAHNRLTGIENLSQGFADCASLKYLVLRSNELTEFPRACYSLPNLELLDLKKNSIEALPEDLDRMTGLRVLSVVRNKIKRLPICIGQMKGLTQFATRRNPITFPPREVWAIDAGAEDDAKVDERSNDREKSRDMAETAKIKKFLLGYQNRERIRDGDSEMSEGNLETPRPTRRKTGGRFPIKPSVGGVENNSDPIVPSPRLPKPPPLPSKPHTRSPKQLLNPAFRPGVGPIVTSNLNERNRSHSESQMGTSVREKRMGIITKKEAMNLEKLQPTAGNRLSHLRGLSHGSALANSTVPPVSDSSSPSSPVDGDVNRPTRKRRLSALPEDKRKSRVKDLRVELARGLVYSLKQVYTPLRVMIRLRREDGIKHSSVERTFYNAFSFHEILERTLETLDSRQEDENENEKRQSALSIHDSCIACIKTFQSLAVVLKKNLKLLVLHSDPLVVRTMMHMLYASLIEVRNACLKLTDVELVPISGDEYHETERGRHSSLSQRRPVTSLRVRDAQAPVNANGYTRGTRQLPLGQYQEGFNANSRTASNTSLGPAVSRSMDHSSSFAISNTSLSRNNTFASYEEDEPQLFDRILKKLNAAADLAAEAFPSCITMLSNARSFASGKPDDTEVNLYDVLIDKCKRVRDAADTMKRRLRKFHSRDPPSSNSPEFWSTVTVFTKEHLIFAGNIKEYSKTASFPLEIRALLKPMHGLVKDIGRTVSNSPWAQMADTRVQQPRVAYQQQSFASSQSHSQASSIHGAHAPQIPQQPLLTLQTKSPIIPPNPSEPMSAVSMVSSNGNSALSSGHATPLPATPMSAALGPAALATVPAVPELPTTFHQLGAGYATNGSTNAGSVIQAPGASTIERSRSVSQRR